MSVKVMTVFCCGTSSWGGDVINTDIYEQGEIVSTFAYQHEPTHHYDTITLPGPESIGTSGNSTVYSTLGKLTGYGWEVATNMAVNAIYRFAVTRLKADDELRLILVGWSRGGITTFMIANDIAQLNLEASLNIKLDIKMLVFDPVAGISQNYGSRGLWIPDKVSEFVGYYAHDELSTGFSSTIPIRQSNENSCPFKSTLIDVPGRHATMVGNLSFDGAKGERSPIAATISDAVRGTALTKLTEWNATFNKPWADTVHANRLNASKAMAAMDWKEKLSGFRNEMRKHYYIENVLSDTRHLWLDYAELVWRKESSLEQAIMTDQQLTTGKSYFDLSAWYKWATGSQVTPGLLTKNVSASTGKAPPVKVVSIKDYMTQVVEELV